MKRKNRANWYRRKRAIYRVLSISALFFILEGVVDAVKLFRLHFAEEDLSGEIERLKVENSRMEEEKRLLEEDPHEIEKRAREELGMIREGDRVYRVVRPDREKGPSGGLDSREESR